MEIAKTLAYLSTFSVGIPFLLMLICRKKMKHRFFTWLGLLILISFIADIAVVIIVKNQIQYSTVYIQNIQDLFQLILLLLIYHEFYLKEKKIVVILVTIIYICFGVVNSIFFQKPDVSQTWSWALSGLIFICISVGYFARLFKSSPMVDITSFAPGWINIAVFFYFSFSVYLFIMAEYVFTSESIETAVTFWGFHNFNNILKNCFYALAIYCGGQKETWQLTQERTLTTF